MMNEDPHTFDWARIAGELNADGYAQLGPVLSEKECARLAEAYDDDARYRSRVIMGRHGFGQGEYKYFAHPLPEPVAVMRTLLFPPLARIAPPGRSMDVIRTALATSSKVSPCRRSALSDTSISWSRHRFRDAFPDLAAGGSRRSARP